MVHFLAAGAATQFFLHRLRFWGGGGCGIVHERDAIALGVVAALIHWPINDKPINRVVAELS